MIFQNHARQSFFVLLTRQDLCAGNGHNVHDSSHATQLFDDFRRCLRVRYHHINIGKIAHAVKTLTHEFAVIHHGNALFRLFDISPFQFVDIRLVCA